MKTPDENLNDTINHMKEKYGLQNCEIYPINYISDNFEPYKECTITGKQIKNLVKLLN